MQLSPLIYRGRPKMHTIEHRMAIHGGRYLKHGRHWPRTMRWGVLVVEGSEYRRPKAKANGGR